VIPVISVPSWSSSLRRVLSSGRGAPFQLLGEQVAGSPAVGVAGGLQRRLQRLKQRGLRVLAERVLG